MGHIALGTVLVRRLIASAPHAPWVVHTSEGTHQSKARPKQTGLPLARGSNAALPDNAAALKPVIARVHILRLAPRKGPTVIRQPAHRN